MYYAGVEDHIKTWESQLTLFIEDAVDLEARIIFIVTLASSRS